MGYVPTWLLLGLALMFCRQVPRRLEVSNICWSFAPFFSCAIAGGLAEVLKIVFRRMRADQVEGAWYVFRPITDQAFSSSGLSMPSGHASVAFGAAFMLTRMYPRGWPVFLLLGIGCAATRVRNADHYLSDVYVAAIAGYVTAWTLTHFFARRDRHVLIEAAQAVRV
jgi:membrane-associated phospholipid phosphatase